MPPEDAHVLDTHLGKFPDGSVHPIQEKTVADIRELLKRLATNGGNEKMALWQGTTLNHNKIRIVQRLDK